MVYRLEIHGPTRDLDDWQEIITDTLQGAIDRLQWVKSNETATIENMETGKIIWET